MSIDGITRKWCSRHQEHDRCFVERDAAADWQARALAAEAQVAHYRKALERIERDCVGIAFDIARAALLPKIECDDPRCLNPTHTHGARAALSQPDKES